MDGFVIPNRGLISLKTPAIVRSSCKFSKCVEWVQSFELGLQLGGWARSGVSRLSAYREQHNEKFTDPSTYGAWDSMLFQLRSRALMSTCPETSLRQGTWVKLICGASFESHARRFSAEKLSHSTSVSDLLRQDLAEVRNLSLVYTLAGVDCIDCAADSAVVAAVVEGVTAAKNMLETIEIRRPWIMISVNDDVDPHFRKAEFDSKYCPSDCPRPCESVCPASAIKFHLPGGDPETNSIPLDGGVIMERCYGCGRCLSVCPRGFISASTYVRPTEAVANLLMTTEVDAIEIHTGAGHLEAFKTLVSNLGGALSSVKLVAVSVPDLGEAMIPTMTNMYASMQPFLKHLNLWQLDGRPMSGDIGVGATRAAVALGARLVVSADRPQGYLQLAGGTNAHTAVAMKERDLLGLSATLKAGDSTREALIGGVAFGGYARKVVSKKIQRMHGDNGGDDSHSMNHSRLLLEQYPSLFIGALQEAIALVDTVKDLKEA